MLHEKIDTLGLLAELQKQIGNDLKTQVKVEMKGKQLAHAYGELFEATLVDGSDVQTIDPARFLWLYQHKRITRKQFLAAIRVNNEEAAKAVSKDELKKISTFKPKDDALYVKPRNGIEVSLVTALEGLGGFVAANNTKHSTAEGAEDRGGKRNPKRADTANPKH